MKIKKRWKDGRERFVLYLDIMGFKERVRCTNILKLKKALVNFHDKFVKLKPLLEGLNGDGGKKVFMKMVQFSDSIVIVSKEDTKGAVYFPIEDGKIKLKGGISNHYYVAWHKMEWKRICLKVICQKKHWNG